MTDNDQALLGIATLNGDLVEDDQRGGWLLYYPETGGWFFYAKELPYTLSSLVHSLRQRVKYRGVA
jgi:hypothetical protein